VFSSPGPLLCARFLVLALLLQALLGAVFGAGDMSSFCFSVVWSFWGLGFV